MAEQHSSIRVATYSPDAKDQVVGLLRQHWNCETDRARRYFEWRYELNPYTDTPSILIARDGDRVVGVRCFVVEKFGWDGVAHLIACPADAFVDPEYRRQGIMRRLSLESFEYLDSIGVELMVNLSANRSSAALARSVGSSEIGETRYLYRLGAAVAKKRSLIVMITSTLEETKRPPQSERRSISNVRDEAFYWWRYREPDTRFRYIVARDGDSLGYVMLKRLSRRKYDVMEYGGDTSLSEMLSAFSAEKGFCLFRILDFGLDESETDLLKSAGFMHEPRWLTRKLGKHRPGAFVRPISGTVPDGRWHLTPADIH